ncbi:hypothetical protein ABZ252_01865 [Streptomyces sp. NPDC006175]|uniref:hypothetical protein n=1 Tax=unclassified Streptomyces TaxID=2593676 RepID=UPI0033AE8807
MPDRAGLSRAAPAAGAAEVLRFADPADPAGAVYDNQRARTMKRGARMSRPLDESDLCHENAPARPASPHELTGRHTGHDRTR